MRKLVSTFLLVAWMGFTGSAQVFIQNTMYSFNRFVYNPAAAGMKQPGSDFSSNLTLLGRLQWSGIPGAPRLFSASYHTDLPDISSAFGAYVIRDELAALSTTGLNVAYAYQIRINPDDDDSPVLSIGVNGGLLQKAINGNFIYDDGGGLDPIIPIGSYNASDLVPSLGAGIYFNTEKWFVGISGQDLLEPSLEQLLLTQGVGAESKVPRTFYLTAGYTFELNPDMSLSPNILARTDGVRPPQVDLSLYWRYKPVVFGGAYRFYNDSFSAIAGFNVTDRAFIGYAYDYTLNSLNAMGDISSHELIISWSFPSPGARLRQNHDILNNPDDAF